MAVMVCVCMCCCCYYNPTHTNTSCLPHSLAQVVADWSCDRRESSRPPASCRHRQRPSDKLSMTTLQVTNRNAPSVVTNLHDRKCEVNKTDGDGACAIHAVFGEKHGGDIHKKNARQFLRDTLGPTVAEFTRRLADNRILTELQQALWLELVKPCATRAANLGIDAAPLRAEGNMIWQRLQQNSPSLAQQCVNATRSEHVSHMRFTATRKFLGYEFAKLCVRKLENSFVRPLLAKLGLLHEYETTMVSIPGEACVLSKFEVLFSEGQQADKLHQSIVEHCGVSHFDVLAEKVAVIASGMELCVDTERIFNLCKAVDDAHDTRYTIPSEPFPDFFEQTYPSYLEAMSVVMPQYYLSDVELLALCRCASTNVVIFQRNIVSKSLTYLRSTIVDRDAPLRLASIQIHPHAASARTHLEKYHWYRREVFQAALLMHQRQQQQLRQQMQRLLCQQREEQDPVAQSLVILMRHQWRQALQHRATSKCQMMKYGCNACRKLSHKLTHRIMPSTKPGWKHSVVKTILFGKPSRQRWQSMTRIWLPNMTSGSPAWASKHLRVDIRALTRAAKTLIRMICLNSVRAHRRIFQNSTRPICCTDGSVQCATLRSIYAMMLCSH